MAVWPEDDPTEEPEPMDDGAPMFCPVCRAPRTLDQSDGSPKWYCQHDVYGEQWEHMSRGLDAADDADRARDEDASSDADPDDSLDIF